MHASHARSRRQDRLGDDELFAVARSAERRPDPYSRSHHHSSRPDPYGDSSTPQRGYAESSRTRRSGNWRVAEPAYISSAHDRYHDEAALQSRRDGYYDRPEGWTDRPAEHSQYSSSRREWTKRNDQEYTTTSYSETRSWARTSRYDEPSRVPGGNEDWYREDGRDERERERYDRDESYAARERDLRPRDDVVAIEPARAHRSPYWTKRTDDRPQWRRNETERGHQDQEHDVVAEPDLTSLDTERKWEPAPSWKSREREDHVPARYERTAHLPPVAHPGKKFGKNKKKNQQAYQKHAKREDNTNNWHKREFIPSQRYNDATKPSGGKRRHEQSLDSRSRSPTRSIYSQQSSNRSRSRSLSPKRRKRVGEPQERATIIPASKKGGNRWSAKPQGDESRSQTRRSSISSRSSQSRSRSRSSSEPPADKPKPKHRLPMATSLRDIEVQAKALRLSSGKVARRTSNIQNGPSKALAKAEPQTPTITAAKLREAKPVQKPQDEYEAMPPPTAPASASLSTSTNGVPPSIHPTSTVVVDAQPRFAKRNAGFKPIGTVQPSPAMKRFFPGEEDEEPNIVQEARQDKREATRPVRQTENSSEARLQRGSRTPLSVLSDKDADTHDMLVQRENRSLSVSSVNGEPVNRSVARTRQHDQLKNRSPTIHPSEVVPAYMDPTVPLGPRALPTGRIARINGKTSREPSQARTPEAPNHRDADRTETASSPAQRQTEDAVAAEKPSEGLNDQVYAIVSQVGEGTFGKVYKARNTITGIHVALKRIRMETERDGFPVTAMREIKLLQSLRHVNIVQLVEMMVHNGSVYMVFEYMDHDLTGVLSQTQFSFTAAHLKSLCQQMLQGLSYLHRKGVIHRDIKGSNILLNNRGELKLADFGLARFYQKRRRADYTNRVITLWYRPPELLLGTTVYGPEVDMWSAGCIMLELFCKKPVFQGNDEIHQLDVIYKILGTPTPDEWPTVTDMPWYELVKPRDTLRNRFRELFNRWLSPAALDLAERLLTYDPEQRVTADQALEAPYFNQEEPCPALPVGLATLEGEWHEFESKRERAKKRRKVEAVSGSAEPSSLPHQ